MSLSTLDYPEVLFPLIRLFKIAGYQGTINRISTSRLLHYQLRYCYLCLLCGGMYLTMHDTPLNEPIRVQNDQRAPPNCVINFVVWNTLSEFESLSWASMKDVSCHVECTFTQHEPSANPLFAEFKCLPFYTDFPENLLSLISPALSYLGFYPFQVLRFDLS
jgi:hypothetical protein